jgi:protein TonB
MRTVYNPPHFPRTSAAPVLGAVIATLILFLILPFTQLFSNVRREIVLLRPLEVVIPPPPPPPKQPPEEKKPEEKPELKEKPKPLTLSQLELALNPGVGGALEGDFGLGFAASAPDVVEEMKIFELFEVDKEPQLLYQAQPLYPARLAREKIGGTVVIQFVVDEHGNVTSPQFKERSSRRELDEAAMASVLKYKFSPGIKDGRPVRVRYEVPIVFDPHR